MGETMQCVRKELLVCLCLALASGCGAEETFTDDAGTNQSDAGTDAGSPDGGDEPDTCDDGIKNADETDVDCGGSCDSCAVGMDCVENEDCASGTCTNNVCVAAPTCTDGVRNGGESDVDCGAVCATQCAIGKACTGTDDCQSGVCHANVCRELVSSISLAVATDVTPAPTVHLYLNSGERIVVVPGAITLTRAEICGSQYMVNGVRKHGAKVNAESNGQWWDCDLAHQKLSQLRFQRDSQDIPQSSLETFNNGQACQGAGVGDLFLSAEALGILGCP